MNSKKAKAIRKIVWGDFKPAPRKYMKLKSTGMIINTGDIEEIDDGTGRKLKIPRRRIYQHIKKISKGVPRKALTRTFLNENSKTN